MRVLSHSRGHLIPKVPNTLAVVEHAPSATTGNADQSVNSVKRSTASRGLGSKDAVRSDAQPADELDLSADAKSQASGELTEEEKAQVDELKARDREVRTHEQAHKAAAGPYARGGPTYDYQTGPDGRKYAVGGEVQIDTSAVPGDPEATIRKARVVRAAALAPAEPSSQDRAVAAAATKLEQQAQIESRQQNQDRSIDGGREEGGADTVASGSASAFGLTDLSAQNELVRSIVQQQLVQQASVVDFVA